VKVKLPPFRRAFLVYTAAPGGMGAPLLLLCEFSPGRPLSCCSPTKSKIHKICAARLLNVTFLKSVASRYPQSTLPSQLIRNACHLIAFAGLFQPLRPQQGLHPTVPTGHQQELSHDDSGIALLDDTIEVKLTPNFQRRWHELSQVPDCLLHAFCSAFPPPGRARAWDCA
jgi:hypothetical protein